ncbi:MAG: Putative serine protease [uncultured Pseudonocardia sp.]|uniref:Serine protease n=1 Tax=uncultured Pseudonocardia sp. TaxID=211455 RepID=A0A6J4QCH5_9PSEU|nr:MAG: Putative serine protease [uncultured Pseudonocardia sp.]
MSWVDLVVVALALVAGVSGWRHGVAVAFLSFVGVLTGAIIGVRLAPLLVAGIDSTNAQIIVSILVVVLLVAIGETTGVFFGRRIRDRITGERSLAVDSTLGAVLQALTVVVAAWLVALPLASASFPGLASAVQGSEVLRGVDRVMPASARALPDELSNLLDNSGFPQILRSPFDSPPIEEVGPPDPALVGNPVVAGLQDSVLKVRGRAPSCQRALEGTGFVIGDGVVVTNAHVVAGTEDVGVEVRTSGGGTRELPGTVVLYDPSIDIAVLRVPDLDAPALPFRPQPAAVGEDVIILGYPMDGPYTPSVGKVRQTIQLQGPDIYDDGEVTREVYTVRAVVRSGNSGGPMIDVNGQVVGVVFGAALDDSETGFVLTNAQVSTVVNPAAQIDRPVDTGPCAN